MSASYRLSVDTRIWFEDEQHDVVGFTETATRLRSASGGMQIIATGVLLADPSFRHCMATDGAAARPVAAVDTAAMLEILPQAERDRVVALRAHLLELTTGYRSGDPATGGPGEPRAEYALSASVEERVTAKATELGVSQRSVWKYLRRWREQGLWGLVDGPVQAAVQPSRGI